MLLCIFYYLVFTDDYFVCFAKALESQATAAGDDALKLPARTVRRSDALSVAKRLAAKRWSATASFAASGSMSAPSGPSTSTGRGCFGSDAG